MVKLKDSFKRCKTLKIGGFVCMTNNLKGGRGRGFFGFRITLSLVFFCTSTSSVTLGVRRGRGNVKKGTPTTKATQNLYRYYSDCEVCTVFFYYCVFCSAIRYPYSIGYGYGVRCTLLYSPLCIVCKVEPLRFEAILVAKR